MTLQFQKYVGAGNDFVFALENQLPSGIDRIKLSKAICDPKLGIGADGFAVFKKLSESDFEWDFYNNDGSRAEMCGNAARCAILFCQKNFSTNKSTIKTEAGIVSGQVLDANWVAVSWALEKMEPEKKSLTLSNGKTVEGLFVNTGVPHFVVQQEGINGRDCLLIQEHEEFAPAQTNVTVLNPKDGTNHTKSFERGVRAFTLACGTGVIASAIALSQQEKQDEYSLQAPGGPLKVRLGESEVTLIGPAQFVFDGSNFNYEE